ncbi:hypothetical protein BWI96_00935 [Siphonobacter sp. SORGH_AS_0500]|uniref:hypothetical protein n=1 Tax=Siphonobacter sp. SORGH_AS_0500 TaxID=1864824 RepID=UPI000CB751F5|nr:hypothetical protein [Siphonobacter sp. SORGH_AS_0500]PKK38378.1 hypothetical protein BWI96_00935 [Siphonobacter sp. SORGH_AS_0500]
MEQFRKDLFFKEYGYHISLQPISTHEKLFLEDFFRNQYGMNSNNSLFKDLVDRLFNKRKYGGINTSAELEAVLKDLALLKDTEVFVIWNYPNEIDKFALAYLLQYWEDIWFSVSDEAIGMFFPMKSRMIVITHYDVVYY